MTNVPELDFSLDPAEQNLLKEIQAINETNHILTLEITMRLKAIKRAREPQV